MSDVTLPQLGETVTEGTITKWLKQVGDQIAEDEPLYEVSTEKVDSEVPSPVAGYLAEILVPEGETADVGAKLAVITDSPPGDAAAGAPEPEAVSDTEAEEQGADVEAEAEAAETESPGPARGAVEEQEQAAATTTQARPEPSREPAGAGGATAGDGSRLLSPVVRRLIAENDLDPAQIEGTGSGGRITRNDVLAYLDQAGQKAGQEAGQKDSRQAPAREAPRPAARGPQPSAPRQPSRPSEPAAAPADQRTERVAPEPPARAGERDEVVPFSNIRKRTAEHMVRSQATSAHTLVVIEVDYQNVDTVRSAAKDQFRADEGISLSYLPFIARALIDAIREFPHVNASVGEDELVVHNYVNLGIAVDLNFEGLIVPVIRDADGKRLRLLAREIADLANRARSKKLGADEVVGGTFTITNPGPFGTFLTAPVINQPQVAILSTDAAKPRPVAIEMPDGTYGIAVHPVGNLALSFDHRAYDGAYASAFLARVKEILETRDWDQEL